MNNTDNNPAKIERNLSIANDRLAGHTYRQLAKDYNLSTGMISYILNDEEIKDVIESGTRELISRVPLAISRYDKILNSPDHSDHYKAIKDCLQTTGIFPSHTPSTVINNIMTVNTGPSVQDIERIQELLQSRQAIDVEYSTDDTINPEDCD